MRAGSSPTTWRWDEANTTVVATRMEYARLNLEIKDTWWRYGKLHTLLGRLEYPLCATVMSYAPLDSQDTQDTQIKKITRAHRKITMQNTLYIPRKQYMLRDASARETARQRRKCRGPRLSGPRQQCHRRPSRGGHSCLRPALFSPGLASARPSSTKDRGSCQMSLLYL